MTLFLQVSMSKFLSGRIHFLKTSNFSFLAAKNRLEKRFGGSTSGESWKMSIYMAKYGL